MNKPSAKEQVKDLTAGLHALLDLMTECWKLGISPSAVLGRNPSIAKTTAEDVAKLKDAVQQVRTNKKPALWFR